MNTEVVENNMNSQEILDALDLGKITLGDKKKRGRPKKSQQLVNLPTNKVKINNTIFEQDEIILHLPLSTHDIETSKDTTIDKIMSKHIIDKDTEPTSDTERSDEDEYISKTDHYNVSMGLKQANLMIKRLKEENEQLKKYLIEITPMYFTEVKTYPSNLKIYTMEGEKFIPQKTNIPCWWCTYNFDWLPVGLPEYYHNSMFHVRGCFCSFNCMASYNLNINDTRVWDRYSLMKLLYYYINKDKITSVADIVINPAGPKELLEKYGGSMTIEEYRKNSKIIGKEYHTLIPPFFPIGTGFEECTTSKTNAKTMNIHNILSSNSKDITKKNKPSKSILTDKIDTLIE